MPTALLSPVARQQFFVNGVPASGHLLYTYAANTTTPQTTYSNRGGTVANANPIVLDSDGRTPAGLYLESGVVYDYVFKTAAGVTVYTQEDVEADPLATDLASSGKGAALIAATQEGLNAVTRTQQERNRDRLSAMDFIGHNLSETAGSALRFNIRARSTTAADKANIVLGVQAAINAANARGGVAVYLPAGLYWADGLNVSGMNNLVIVGDGPDATEIRSDSTTASVFTATTEGRYRRFDGFSISSSVTRTAGSYFSMAIERRTVWSNLRLTGWFNAFTVPAAEMSYIDRCWITKPSGLGDALTLATPGAAGQVSGFVLFDSFIRGNDDILQTAPVGRFGIICYDVDALWVVNTDVGGFVEGDMLISPTTRAANIYGLQSFFDATKNNDCLRMAGAGAKKQITFNGCWFASAGKLTGGNVEACGIRAMNEGSYQDINFDACRIYSNSGSGALIEAPGADIHFSNPMVYFNGALATTNRHGIKWAPATAATVGPSISGGRFGGANAPKDISIGANGNSKCSIQGPHLETGIDYAAPLGKASGFDPTAAVVASATRPVISPFHDFVRVTGTTNIAGMDVTYPGHMVTLKFDGVLTVIDASQNFALVGNFTTAAGSTLTLRCDGATWWEVARANT